MSNRPVLVAAIVGFLQPILWGILGFILFNLRNGLMADAYYFFARLCCPAWLLPGIWGDWLSPAINAALYAVVCYGVVEIRKGRSGREIRDSHHDS